MRLLYVGAMNGTSRHRAEALGRLGYDVSTVSPDLYLPKNRWLRKFHWETGGVFMQHHVRREVVRAIEGKRFDFCWVDNGRYVGASLVRFLKGISNGPVVCLNVDDPFGSRDRLSWSTYRRAVGFYNLVVVVRSENVREARDYGAKDVLLVKRTADESAHKSRCLSQDDYLKWHAPVLFLGTWFPERGPFLAELLRRGVPVRIRGDRWRRAKEWPELEHAYLGGATKSDDEYACAIQAADVCLGLLSKGNRDRHTTRSSEIPFLGGVFCAERTDDHLEMYEEGEEAVFWEDVEECAEQCIELLRDEALRARIRVNGHRRAVESGYTNEVMCRQVIEEAMGRMR